MTLGASFFTIDDEQVRDRFIQMSLSLGAFAILLGFLLGLRGHLERNSRRW